MINAISRYLSIATCALCFLSCHKNNNNPAPLSDADVYLIGSDGTGGKLWKNGTVTDLGMLTSPAALIVAANNIYICGNGAEYNGKQTLKYWKNGAETNITDGKTYAAAFGMCVNGNDVYICGRWQSASNAGIEQATYWKNGTPVVLTPGYESGTVYGIAVVGNDVYALGNHGQPQNLPTACYWKNGVSTDLAAVGTYAESSSIYTNGNEVYLLWSVANGQMEDSRTYYSKNFSSAVELTNGSYNGYDNALTVAGSDVYASGTALNNNVLTATYWKNGTPMYVSTETQGAFATGIAVSGGDIYLSGWTQNVAKGKAPTACYWKNGEKILLGDGSSQSVARGIAVVKK